MVQRFGTPSILCWKSPQPLDEMHSPLPDSSALEAGILEDAQPSRLSRVQDNVRNLLRTSVLGSVKSSPTSPAHMHGALPTPVSIHRENDRAEVLPDPAPMSETIRAFPQPPASGQSRDHRSQLFNDRAVMALNHPDLSDPSLESFSQQKSSRRQRRGWKRSRGSRRAAQRIAGSRALLCLLASLLLAALVATYVSIATTSQDLTTTFHILFVLGICLATIVFAHSVIRLFFVGRRTRHRPLFVAVSRHGHHRDHRSHRDGHRPPQLRRMPPVIGQSSAFVPPTPIPVHVSSDDLRADARTALPSAMVADVDQDWDKEVHSVPNPPPAYGRWRDSVRANPDLLHWQAVPSPSTPDTPALPSPTYEEAIAMTQGGYPPSYVTRDSPARRRVEQEGIAYAAQAQAVEAEMVEVRSTLVGSAL